MSAPYCKAFCRFSNVKPDKAIIVLTQRADFTFFATFFQQPSNAKTFHEQQHHSP